MPTHVTVGAEDTLVMADVAFGGNSGALQVPPKFPLAIAATKDLLNWSNTFPTEPIPTLAVDIGLTDTTINLTSGNGAQLPTENFEVSIDAEIIFVNQRGGDALLNCVRGVEGSVVALHFTGANVQLLITALSHNQLVSEVIAIEQELGPKAVNVRTFIAVN